MGNGIGARIAAIAAILVGFVALVFIGQPGGAPDISPNVPPNVSEAPVGEIDPAVSGVVGDSKVAQFTLDNGMRILVIPDHRAPVVSHMVWYRVGGVDDPPGLSGIAHFFEHLMFKGTDTIPPGEFSRIVARNGGTDNAFTGHDYTAYFQRIARDRLSLVMGLEADRMENLILSDENVATEREVVREERNMRVESDPSSLFREQMSAALFLSHPYGRPVIGWDEEIQQIGREEAIDFYTHHYAPNNAMLVVTGDVEPMEVLHLAQETYGLVPARELAPRSNPAQPPRLTETRINLEHADARLPILMRMYRVPTYKTGDPGVAEAFDMLTTIMGGGATSRLYRALVVEQQIAVSAGSYYDGSAAGLSEFGVYGYPAEGVSFDEVEAAIDEVIEEMMSAPPEPGEFERARTRLVAAHIYEQDSQFALAMDYGLSLTIGLTVEDVETWPDRIEMVTPEDVQNVARDYLINKEAVTGTLSPLTP
ncbi:MAG: pitrilysin family protein [Micropepsaceae bacterium]